MSPRALLAMCICALLLGSCTVQPTLSESEAAAARARAALMDASDRFIHSTELSEEQREAIRPYHYKLARAIYFAELSRELIAEERIKPEDAEYIDRSLTAVFNALADMASMHANMFEGTTPATPESEAAITQLREPGGYIVPASTP